MGILRPKLFKAVQASRKTFGPGKRPAWRPELRSTPKAGSPSMASPCRARQDRFCSLKSM